MTSVQRLSPGQLTLATLRALFEDSPTIELDEESRARVARAEATVSDILDSGRTVYGINTGFGVLAQTSIPRAS
ncbi:MAG: aromatic amino acid lyase, partial [Gammaproteobacteria bacterium]|nr:aromatic amino acid lyase [Gammaproteobacteria bacterium]